MGQGRAWKWDKTGKKIKQGEGWKWGKERKKME